MPPKILGRVSRPSATLLELFHPVTDEKDPGQLARPHLLHTRYRDVEVGHRALAFDDREWRVEMCIYTGRVKDQPHTDPQTAWLLG